MTKISPEKQRIVGIGLLIFALAMTYWVWQNAMTTGSYLKIAPFIFPAFAVLGLAMAIFGPKLSEGLPEHGQPKLRDIPLLGKVCGGFALVAGIVNTLFMDGTLPL